jgi:hypothetical protein
MSRGVEAKEALARRPQDLVVVYAAVALVVRNFGPG